MLFLSGNARKLNAPALSQLTSALTFLLRGNIFFGDLNCCSLQEEERGKGCHRGLLHSSPSCACCTVIPIGGDAVDIESNVCCSTSASSGREFLSVVAFVMLLVGRRNCWRIHSRVPSGLRFSDIWFRNLSGIVEYFASDFLDNIYSDGICSQRSAWCLFLIWFLRHRHPLAGSGTP